MPRTDRKRKATHAGSWYDNNASSLRQSLEGWLEAAQVEGSPHARAIISPHAGYSYCGHVMAFAYKQIDPMQVARVFILGPSHHYYLQGCGLTSLSHYSCPLGDLAVDEEVCSRLEATGKFETLSASVDEAEHSLELQLSMLCAAMGRQPFTIVPIMVGSIPPSREREYGELLAPYLEDPANLFIVSSDFCHWGSRFNYTPYDKSRGPVHKYIEWLDRTGMDIIEQGDPAAFSQYLKQTRNTICGRHPIGLFLNAAQACKGRKHAIKFLKYAQSSAAETTQDSSVSYAAASVTSVPV